MRLHLSVMLYTIVINDHHSWKAPDWVARNLIAHLDPSFVLGKTGVEKRFSDLLGGRSHRVDLSEASTEEMRELRRVAEFARQVVKRPSDWEDPASALEFTSAYDRFLIMLRNDERSFES